MSITPGDRIIDAGVNGRRNLLIYNNNNNNNNN